MSKKETIQHIQQGQAIMESEKREDGDFLGQAKRKKFGIFSSKPKKLTGWGPKENIWQEAKPTKFW